MITAEELEIARLSRMCEIVEELLSWVSDTEQNPDDGVMYDFRFQDRTWRITVERLADYNSQMIV